MEKAEAREVAAALLSELRTLPYEELARRLLDRQETSEVVGASGTRYQLEAQAFRDSRGSEDLRVTVAVDDGGLRAFFPLSVDFIIAPDGSFVGE